MRAVGDQRRDALLCGAGHFPQFFTRERIEARDQLATAKNHLKPACCLDDHRRGVVRDFRTFPPPDFATGFFIQSNDCATDFSVGLHNDDVAIHHRRTAVPLVHLVFAYRLLPKNLAVEANCRGERLVSDHKVHEQPLAIVHHHCPGMRGVRVQPNRELPLVHLRLPNDLAIGLVDAEHSLKHFILIRRGEINALPHHRRRAVAPARDRSFPNDIFRLTPLRRQSIDEQRLAVGGESAPVRPIGGGKLGFGSQAVGQADEQKYRSEFVHGELNYRRGSVA